MDMALVIAKRSTCKRKQVGCVIVRDNHISSAGYVGSPRGMPHCIDVGCLIGPDNGCLRTLHAESNAIAWAAAKGQVISKGILYSTTAPCLSCAKLVIGAGIQELFYLESYRERAGLELLFEYGLKITQLFR